MSIEFDYTLERDEGNEVVVFRPKDLKSPLPDIARIVGPNSSGKSTLLNIIALGLYGEKQVTNDKLREQISYLRDSKHQKLSFSFTLRADGIELSAVKKDGTKRDIVVTEKVNGKSRLLDDESFLERYELLYDVPDNPIKRLSELGLGIKSLQKQCMDRMSDFSLHINAIISDVTNAVNHKLHIERLNDDISKLEKEAKEIDEECAHTSSQLKLFREFTYAKLYLKYEEELKSCNNELLETKQKIASVRKDRIVKSPQDRNRTEAYRIAHGIRRDYQEAYELLIQLFSKDKKYLETKRRQFEGNFSIEELVKIFKEDSAQGGDLTRYEKQLKDLEETLNRNNEVDVYNFYYQLANWITSNAKSDFMLPGIGTKLSKFVSSLQSEIKKGKEIMETHNYIRNALIKLDAIRNSGAALEEKVNIIAQANTSSKIGNGRSAGNNDLSELEIAKTHLERRKHELEELIDNYRKNCAKLDISENAIFGRYLGAQQALNHKYDDMATTQLEAKLAELEREEADLNRSKDTIATQINANRIALETLKLQKTPPYSDRYNELISIRDALTDLQFKLRKYSQFIDIMLRGSGNQDGERGAYSPDHDEEFNEYSEAVSSYLAKTIGKIRHVSKTYELASVDLLNQKIVTKDGKTIRLAEMGTGQSQAAFLVSLLSRPTHRKLIVMFDEVSMLDEDSRNLVFSKIESLYSERKLLAALIVEPGKKASVFPILGGTHNG